jgi:hypothetical protein
MLEAYRRLRDLERRFPSSDVIEDLKADAGYGYRIYGIEPPMKDGEVIELRTFLDADLFKKKE